MGQTIENSSLIVTILTLPINHLNFQMVTHFKRTHFLVIKNTTIMMIFISENTETQV